MRTRHFSLSASFDVLGAEAGAGDGAEEAEAVAAAATEGEAFNKAAFLDAKSTFCVPSAAL